jgi:hypothetical protein
MKGKLAPVIAKPPPLSNGSTAAYLPPYFQVVAIPAAQTAGMSAAIKQKGSLRFQRSDDSKGTVSKPAIVSDVDAGIFSGILLTMPSVSHTQRLNWTRNAHFLPSDVTGPGSR